MSVYRRLLRPLVFRLDPETAHNIASGVANRLSPAVKYVSGDGSRSYHNDRLRTDICGIEVDNPVGLAAGFDKGGRAVDVYHAIGLGFGELGSVTGQPQPGNKKSRIFRYPQDFALINRMGFNSEGSVAVGRRLRAKSPQVPIGINIGKTKAVPLDKAVDDYLFSLDNLFPFADYLTINVSSPNTLGLRTLQEGAKLYPLLIAIRERSEGLAADYNKKNIPPIFVKIAPDLADSAIDEVIQVVDQAKINGIIATNTTIDKSTLRTPTSEIGGISGRPLTLRAREVVAYIYKKSSGRIFIIGVGGLMDANDVYYMIRAGANAIQLGTGLVYGGWELVDEVKQGLVTRMDRDGVANVRDLVGIDSK